MAIPKKKTTTSSNSTGAAKKKADIEDNKFYGALGYVGAFCFVPLIMRKNSAFAQFHAKQGLALFLVEMVGFFFLWTFILTWLGGIILVASLVVAMWGIMDASGGGSTKIPGLSHLVHKLNL